MRRIAALFLAIASGLPAHADVPRLRPDATVATELVRIRDVIDNAGRFADVAIFRAPDLGHQGALPAWRVVEAATRAGLSGIEIGTASEVVITREARIVPLSEVEEKVATAAARALGLADPQRVAVTFDRDTRAPAFDPAQTGMIVVSRFTHEPRTGRFEAVLDATGATPPRQGRAGHRVTGLAIETVEVVVPARPIARGEVVRANDLIVERRPRSDLVGPAADLIAAPVQAAGQAARRALQPGRPFRAADLMKPELVARDATVLMTVEMPGLALTLRGRALEAGTEGDVIQVQNPNTRRIVQATVTGPNAVTVSARMRPTATATLSPVRAN